MGTPWNPAGAGLSGIREGDMIGTGVGKFAAALVTLLLVAMTRVAKDTRVAQGDPNYLLGEWEVTRSTLGHFFAFTEDGRYSYERYQIPSPGARRVVTGRHTGFARLALRGQTNFLRSMFHFNSVYDPKALLADHYAPNAYELPLPPVDVTSDRSHLYVYAQGD
jgi:hypothetical protein